MLTRSSRLADPAAASTTEAPLRRCDDCELNLGAGPGVTLRAAFACPMFGQPRHGVESGCVAFVPKDSGALLALIYSLDRGLESEQASDAASVALDLIEQAIDALDIVNINRQTT